MPDPKVVEMLDKFNNKSQLQELKERLKAHAERTLINDGDQWDGGYRVAMIDAEIIIDEMIDNEK